MMTSFKISSRACAGLLSIFGGLHLLASAEAEQNWLNWRGPDGQGSASRGEYPARWTPEDIRWKVALPDKGTSMPVVHEGKIYLTSPMEGDDAVLAFDMSGRSLWQTRLGPAEPPKHKTLASSCNASPVSDAKALYVYFKSGHLAALEFDGKVRWKMNVVEQFGRDNLFWDQGTSPVVTDQHVILARMHGGDSWVAGFDKSTGELSWREKRNYKAPNENDNGYTTPVFFEHNGQKAFLLWAADRLTAHSAKDGKLLWSCGGFNPDGNSLWPAIATPVVVGNVVVVPVGRDDRDQARAHGIKLGGSGDVTHTHRLWTREDTGVFVASPAAHDGRVYLLRHRGEIVCLDPATGKTFWTGTLPEHRSPFYASPVIANGILYAAREDGVVFTARVGEKFELLGEQPMGERIIASPLPVANRLLLRGDKHLFCIGTRK